MSDYVRVELRMIKRWGITSFPYVLRKFGRISWVICEAFLCVIDNISRSVSLAFFTIFPDFSITETSIQTNFDNETHDFFPEPLCLFNLSISFLQFSGFLLLFFSLSLKIPV